MFNMSGGCNGKFYLIDQKYYGASFSHTVSTICQLKVFCAPSLKDDWFIWYNMKSALPSIWLIEITKLGL